MPSKRPDDVNLWVAREISFWFFTKQWQQKYPNPLGGMGVTQRWQKCTIQSSEAENATPQDHLAATGWKSFTSWFYEISFFEEILYIFKQK